MSAAAARPAGVGEDGRSCPLSDLLAEDAGRAEDEDEDQDEEDDGLRPARLAERRGEDLDEARSRSRRARRRSMLPMPPSTAAVNALRPALKPRSKRTNPKYWPWNTPAAPASAPPIRNVIAIVWLRSTPISWAACWSWAVARIARPSRVRPTNSLEAEHQDERDEEDEDADQDRDGGAQELDA